MGNLQTVVPSGPFDITRNPALLAAQTQSNFIGMFYSYIIHFPGEESESANGYKTSGTTTYFQKDVNIEDTKIRGMNVNIANSTKLTSFTIGFAFTNNSDDQYSVTERKKSFKTFINSVLASVSNESSKRTDLNPAFITSIGFNISKTSSIGFQILAKYSDSTERKEYYEKPIPPFTYEKSEKQIKDINKFSGEIGFGYIFNSDNTEIGFLIRTGDFSWIKKSLTVNADRISFSQNIEEDRTISLNGKHTSGPSITAGGYRRLNSFLAFGLESKFTIQNSFTNRELDVNDDQSSTGYEIVTKKNIQTTKQSYLINGGFEFDLSRNLSFNTGLGYTEVTVIGTAGGGDSRQWQENNIEYSFLTAGFDFILGAKIRVSLIAVGISYKVNGYGYNKEKDESIPMSQEFYQEMKSKGYYLHTGVGVTLSF